MPRGCGRGVRVAVRQRSWQKTRSVPGLLAHFPQRGGGRGFAVLHVYTAEREFTAKARMFDHAHPPDQAMPWEEVDASRFVDHITQ